MRRLAAVLAVAVALLAAAAVCAGPISPTAAAAASEVRVGIWENYPLVFVDNAGRPAGIFVDVIKRVAADNGWKLTFVTGTWDDTLSRLRSGTIDLALGMGQVPVRRKQFDLNSEAVVSDWGQIYTREDDRVRTILDLDGKTVVGWRNDRTFETLKQLARELGVGAIWLGSNSAEANFRMVKNGKADAVVELRIPGRILQRKYGLVASPVVFNSIAFGFGTTKGANKDLLGAIDAYLRAERVDPDSPFNTSLARWLGAQASTTWRVPGWVALALSIIAGLALILVALSLILRRIVRRRTRALAESQERYRTLVEHAPMAVLVNIGDRIVFVNEACVRLFGAESEEQLLGRSPYDLFDPGCHKAVRQGLHRLQDRGEAVPPNEQRIVRMDGSLVEVEVAAAPYQTQEGMAIHVVMLDITARKRGAEAMAASARQTREALHDTVRAMGDIVGLRDPYTSGHEKRVTRLAIAIARELDLDEDLCQGLTLAGEVHDVGKIAVPAEILSKPGRLTETEHAIVRLHPEKGREILSTIAFSWPVAEIVYQHHERLDGSGYPRGLKGDEILLEARVLAVADVVEAMASHRPYRPARGIEAALAEVRDGAETLYDADVVAACHRVIAAGFDLEDMTGEDGDGSRSIHPGDAISSVLVRFRQD